MPNPGRLTRKDLSVGGRYLHVNRLFIRTIDAIEGDTVIYHDQYAQGRCGKSAFLKTCATIATEEGTAQAEEKVGEKYAQD